MQHRQQLLSKFPQNSHSLPRGTLGQDGFQGHGVIRQNLSLLMVLGENTVNPLIYRAHRNPTSEHDFGWRGYEYNMPEEPLEKSVHL